MKALGGFWQWCRERAVVIEMGMKWVYAWVRKTGMGMGVKRVA